MFDYFNIILGLLLLSIGLIITITNLKDKINGKTDKYGAIMKALFAGIGLIITGLVMIFRELL